MKKFTFFLLLFLSINLNAQTRVKGIPINSTFTEFKKQMKEKGYKGKPFDESQYRYNKVDFADYKKCKLDIIYSTTTDSIQIITIKFPQVFMSGNLPIPINESTFQKIKEQLDVKYGEGKFEHNEYPSEDQEEPERNMIYEWQDGENCIRLLYWDFG